MITESILNMANVGKSKIEDFRAKRLNSKEIISCTDKEKQLSIISLCHAEYLAN